MKKLLVVADPYNSEQFAYKYAVKLAMYSSATIHIVAFCYESIDSNSDNKSLLQTKIIEHQKNWWQNKLSEDAHENTFTCEVIWEKYLHHWVLEHCAKNEYDLVIKTGNRSESPFHTPADWQLFRDSTIPVYSVNSHNNKFKKNILVALDLMTHSDEKQRLNKELLEQAFRFSVLTGCALHCCYAIKVPTLAKDLDLIDVDAHVHKQEKLARAKCAELMDEYDIDKELLHIEEGTPWQVITNLSAKLKAQCVVVGTVGRKGIPGKIIGNTSEKVIQFAKNDLLVMS